MLRTRFCVPVADEKSKERKEENIPYVATLLTSASMKTKAKYKSIPL